MDREDSWKENRARRGINVRQDRAMRLLWFKSVFVSDDFDVEEEDGTDCGNSVTAATVEEEDGGMEEDEDDMDDNKSDSRW